MVHRVLALVVAVVLLVGCGDDDAFDADDDVPSTTAAPQTTSQAPTTIVTEAATGCALDPSSGDRPSIGKVGSSIDPSLVPEGVSVRTVGLELLNLVDRGELCLEDVVSYVNQEEETEAFRAALESIIADLVAGSG